MQSYMKSVQRFLFSGVTLPETIIAPENGWLEDVLPIEIVPL